MITRWAAGRARRTRAGAIGPTLLEAGPRPIQLEKTRMDVESAARTLERLAIERETLEIVARGRCASEAVVETAES